MTHRIALGIEYDGSRFHGWQIQPQQLTAAGMLNHALSSIADERILTTCAGRTDVGVHASGQVVHFDTTAIRSIDAWIRGTNSLLPPEIAVKWAKPMPDTFHARFSATARSYQYIIYNAPVRSAIYARTTSFHHKLLDIKPMQAAAQYLIGTHDFSALRDAECQAKSPIRTITDITLTQNGSFITLNITANAFLQHMVRNIVGLLLPIGEGKQPPIWAEEILQGRDRRQSGVTALPNGLTLAKVHYPAEFQLDMIYSENNF